MNDERLNNELGEALREEAPVPDFPRETIAARIRQSIRPRVQAPSGGGWSPGPRWAAAAVAALAIFVGGVEYGRRLATTMSTTAATAVDDAVAGAADPVAFAIQSRGTQYVAELARFSETAATLSEEEAEQARQVAVAILYGAAMELVRAAPDDHLAELLVRALGARRSASDDPLIWF